MLEEAGDLSCSPTSSTTSAIEAYYAGRWDEASSCTGASGELSGRAGDVVNVARAQNNEGEIVSDQGRLAEAEERFLEAQRVWRAARYPVAVALATSTSGGSPLARGRFDEALELLAEALAAFEALGSEAFGQETEARRAECFVLAGRHQEALEVVPAVLEGPRKAARLRLPRAAAGYALVQARRAEEAGPGSSGASSWRASSAPTTRWR